MSSLEICSVFCEYFLFSGFDRGLVVLTAIKLALCVNGSSRKLLDFCVIVLALCVWGYVGVLMRL